MYVLYIITRVSILLNNYSLYFVIAYDVTEVKTQLEGGENSSTINWDSCDGMRNFR